MKQKTNLCNLLLLSNKKDKCKENKENPNHNCYFIKQKLKYGIVLMAVLKLMSFNCF